MLTLISLHFCWTIIIQILLLVVYLFKYSNLHVHYAFYKQNCQFKMTHLEIKENLIQISGIYW